MKKQKINQATLAEAAGVSRSTVSFALNERLASRVHPSTRMHVLRMADRLGYRPNRQAQAIRSGRSYTIGLLHYIGMLQPVIERVTYAAGAIQKAGYLPYAVDMHWFPGREALSLDLLLGAHVDGLIVSCATTSLYRLLMKTPVPKVFLIEPPDTAMPVVCSNIEQGMRDLTRHTLALGHRRLTLILPSGEGNYFSGREHGFTTAIESAGGKICRNASLTDPQGLSLYRDFLNNTSDLIGCIVYHPVPDALFDPYQAGSDIMHHLAKQHRLPDITLFSNDNLALGAMDYCRRNQISIPEQMAVSGFDNTAVGRIAPLGLTTVEQPNQAVAERAVDVLIHLINGDKLSEEELRVRIPCTPVIRESCGAGRTLARSGQGLMPA